MVMGVTLAPDGSPDGSVECTTEAQEPRGVVGEDSGVTRLDQVIISASA